MLLVASPQTSFRVRLSRIHFWGRNECVTNEPQRTSAGRLCSWRRWQGWGGESFFSFPRPRKLALRLEKLFNPFCVCTSCTKSHKWAYSQTTPTDYADSAIAVAPGFLEKPNFAFTTSKPISVSFLSLADKVATWVFNSSRLLSVYLVFPLFPRKHIWMFYWSQTNLRSNSQVYINDQKKIKKASNSEANWLKKHFIWLRTSTLNKSVRSHLNSKPEDCNKENL